MNVLIVPEDPTYDQHILKPVFIRLFRHIGSAGNRVSVCQNPNLQGVGNALQLETMRDVVEKYNGMIDVFVLCVDRDCDEGRRVRLDNLETALGPNFFAVEASQAVETWALAGQQLPPSWRWQSIRSERHVKEQYFDRWVERRGLSNDPSGGRKLLGRESASDFSALIQKCPELNEVAERLRAYLR